MTQSTKRKMIFCEPCSFKKIIEPGEDTGLVEIKTAAIPGGIPELDPLTNKVKNKPSTPALKKFKCPRCGRGVILKDLQQAYAKTLKQIDDKKEQDRIAKDKEERLKDGVPEVKNDAAQKQQERLERERMIRFKKSQPGS